MITEFKGGSSSPFQVDAYWEAVVDRKIATDARLGDVIQRAQKVRKFRNYFDGEHHRRFHKLMKSELAKRGIPPDTSDNYMPRIVNARLDRTSVTSIVSDNELTSAMIQDVMYASHFDSLQQDVHLGAYRDAMGYVLVYFDAIDNTAKYMFEPAYDGNEGMIVFYKNGLTPGIDCCVKVWAEANDEGSAINNTRINVYYPNRIEKFISLGGGAPQHFFDPLDQAPNVWPQRWVDENGDPLGVPVVPFYHSPFMNQGKSVLEDATPVQDIINRLMFNMVFGADYTAFQILFAWGWNPPADITPGSILVAGKEGITSKDLSLGMQAIPAGDLTQIISAFDTAKRELHDITNTPMPDSVSADASGEARKMIENYLVGEIERFQIKAGESWEHCAEIALKLMNLWSGKKYQSNRFTAQWKPAQLRDEAVMLATLTAIAPKIPDDEFLRQAAKIAPYLGWDEDAIQKLVKDRKSQDQQNMQLMAQNMPQSDNNPGNASRNAAFGNQKSKQNQQE